MKKTIVYCLLLILALTPAHVLASTDFQQPAINFEVRILSANNDPLPNAHVWFYEYDNDNPVIRTEGKTDSNGSFSIPPITTTSSDDFRHFLLHVYEPSHGIMAYNWSENATSLRQYAQQESLTITMPSDALRAQGTEIQRSGSGIFKTVKTGTTPSTNPVKVAEMYHLPGSPLRVSATLGNTMDTKIEAKLKVVWPAVSPVWTLAGDRTVNNSTSTTDTWNSAAIGAYDGMDILTEFEFNNEAWELLEQDVDVYDLWHVRERWVEVKVYKFKGGSINGTPRTSSFNRRPYDDVMAYQYGNRHPIGARNERTEDSMTSKSFSVGAKFTVPLPYGLAAEVDLAATSTYRNKTFKIYYDNRDNAKAIAIYDHNTSNQMWYVTQQP